MKLKEGMYVRTEEGYIAKIIDIDSDNYCFFDSKIYNNFGDTFDSCYLDNIDIKGKPSFNPIDLIQEGDYVNGCLVSEIKDKWFILNYEDSETYSQLERKNEGIKSIVTKEQFSSMEYKL